MHIYFDSLLCPRQYIDGSPVTHPIDIHNFPGVYVSKDLTIVTPARRAATALKAILRAAKIKIKRSANLNHGKNPNPKNLVVKKK